MNDILKLNKKQIALNAICPYFTMFPLNFPHQVLAERSCSSDWVLDPFCGRGTTNFAARLLGLPTIGIDVDPVAVAATEAKLSAPRGGISAIVRAAEDLLRRSKSNDIPEGEFWTLAYHQEVLDALCRLREGLLVEPLTAEQSALRGIVLGALHGPLRKSGSSSYFSNQAPRTYAPKPHYAVRFWRRREFAPPRVDVLRIIEERARRYFTDPPPEVRFLTVNGDSRCREIVNTACGHFQPKWIITSPPYYGLRTYGPDQWLRQWFLGGTSNVSYNCGSQISHSSIDAFVSNLRDVWNNVANVSSDDARLIVRFGAINDRPVDPEALLEKSLEDTPWHIRYIESAGTAMNGRRQAMSFSSISKAPLPEFDFWATKFKSSIA